MHRSCCTLYDHIVLYYLYIYSNFKIYHIDTIVNIFYGGLNNTKISESARVRAPVTSSGVQGACALLGVSKRECGGAFDR